MNSMMKCAGLALVLVGSGCASIYTGGPHYGNFTLGAGFTPDPQAGYGIAGGTVAASAQHHPHCAGFIAGRPDHQITVTSPLHLRMYVVSPRDTTLVVSGPSGLFCDDDSAGGLSPEVVARLEPGTYSVWVGGYAPGVQGEYRLMLTEDATRRSVGLVQAAGGAAPGAPSGESKATSKAVDGQGKSL